jgi:hypothetical protein
VSGRPAPADGARDRLVFGAVLAASLAVYAATLAPTVTLEDSGEFLTAAVHLGVPHPPGYPLWCLLAHAFTWLPLGSLAERVHLASACFGALAAAWLFLVARRLGAPRAAAAAASLALAASGVFWSQAVVAEVYTLNALLTVLLLDLALRFRDERRARWLWLLALVLGLGLGNHPMIALVALVLGLWLLAADARALLRPGALAGSALGLALGLSVYAYLPLRAAADPPVNVGDPDTWERFAAHVRRDAYQAGAEEIRYAGGARDVALHAAAAWRDAGRALGWPFAALALVGVATWPRERRGVLWATAGIAAGNTLGLNALLGAEWNPWWAHVHRVYYLPLHAMAALWASAGAAALLRSAGRRGRAPAALAAGALAAAVVGTGVVHGAQASRRGDARAHDWGLDLLDSAPDGAGFLPLEDEVVYPVLYLRHVERRRLDVQILSRDFGWEGRPARTVVSGTPLSAALLRDQPALEAWAAVPRGVAYVLVPRERAPAENAWGAFVPLPDAPRDAALLRPGEVDPFVDALRARYAAYHARLGARLHAHGEPERAHEEFARAEALDPGDAFVEVLLFRIYRDLDLHPEKRPALLARALASFDRRVDPAIDRYYPLTRADVVALVEGLSGAPDGLPPPR